MFLPTTHSGDQYVDKPLWKDPLRFMGERRRGDRLRGRASEGEQLIERCGDVRDSRERARVERRLRRRLAPEERGEVHMPANDCRGYAIAARSMHRYTTPSW
jgi:hypothetical protein